MTDWLRNSWRVAGLSNVWPIEDAARLVVGLPLRALADQTVEGESGLKLASVRELILNSIGVSLNPIEMHWRTPPEWGLEPEEFLAWARQRELPIPPSLESIRAQMQRGLEKASLPVKAHRNIVHKAKAQAVAALLWQQYPELTKKDMAKRREMREIACEGKVYTYPTIEKWIAPMNPNRRPGRRAKRQESE